MNKTEFTWVWQRSDTNIYENNAHEMNWRIIHKCLQKQPLVKVGKVFTSTMPSNLLADAPQLPQKHCDFILADIQEQKVLGCSSY